MKRILVMLLSIFPLLSHAEVIIQNMPPSYKIDDVKERDGYQWYRMIPASSENNNEVDILTREFLQKQTLDNYFSTWYKSLLSKQKNVKATQLTDYAQNNFPTKMWSLQYRNDTYQRDEYILLKVIQGNDGIYVLQKSFYYWPSEETLSYWINYLHTVTLCRPEREMCQ